MTLVACIGGGQLGRMLGLAGLPLGLELRFLDPAPDACAGAVGELIVGAYDDPDGLERLARGADVVTYEFENVPVEAAARVGAVPGVAALERGQDRLHEKELFRSLGIPTARFGSLEETGAAGARQDAAARLRRQGPAARRGAGGDRRGRARRGARPLRPRALGRRRPRPGRRDPFLAGGRERAPGRHPAGDPRTGAGRAAARGGGAVRGAAGRAGLRRRPRGRALRGGRPAARERVRAAGAQHGALDDRRRGDEPVREPPPRNPRPPARADGRPRAVGDGQPDRRGAAGWRSCSRSRVRASISTGRSRAPAARSAT